MVPRICQHVLGAFSVSYNPVQGYQVPRTLLLGVQLATLLRITSTGNNLTGHTPCLGFPLDLELQGLQDKHCFPKDLTAAAATQPSPDKSFEKQCLSCRPCSSKS